MLDAALKRVAESGHKAAKAILRLRRWVAAQIVQDIPSVIGWCEFDCGNCQCTPEKWHACKRRLLESSPESSTPSICRDEEHHAS